MNPDNIGLVCDQRLPQHARWQLCSDGLAPVVREDRRRAAIEPGRVDPRRGDVCACRDGFVFVERTERILRVKNSQAAPCAERLRKRLLQRLVIGRTGTGDECDAGHENRTADTLVRSIQIMKSGGQACPPYERPRKDAAQKAPAVRGQATRTGARARRAADAAASACSTTAAPRG